MKYYSACIRDLSSSNLVPHCCLICLNLFKHKSHIKWLKSELKWRNFSTYLLQKLVSGFLLLRCASYDAFWLRLSFAILCRVSWPRTFTYFLAHKTYDDSYGGLAPISIIPRLYDFPRNDAISYANEQPSRKAAGRTRQKGRKREKRVLSRSGRFSARNTVEIYLSASSTRMRQRGLVSASATLPDRYERRHGKKSGGKFSAISSTPLLAPRLCTAFHRYLSVRSLTHATDSPSPRAFRFIAMYLRGNNWRDPWKKYRALSSIALRGN